VTTEAAPALGVSLRITDPYDERANAATFDTAGWLASQDWALLAEAEGRRVLTRLDPMLFAVVYLSKHLTGDDTGGMITFADAHFEWYRLMRSWVKQRREPREWRHSFAAPRSCAKSTVWFLIAPLWAGAHGHARFVAAFADSGTQSEMHLQSFRTELAHNRKLRRDFPLFCQAQRKPTGRTVADNEGMFQSRNGFVFAARGADTATLGMKVSEQRPDVLILDDIEKHEAQYSLDMVKKRLGTIVNAIFPLNERARVVIVGTTTRPGSIIHQLVQVADGDRAPEGEEHGWIAEERIEAHHHLPIVETDGARRSIWPGKWTLEYLESIEGTRSYELNMLCNPREAGGDLWDSDDILHGLPGKVGRVYCWLDPPVTTKKGSDPAGITIAGYLPTGMPGLPALLADRFKDPAVVARLLARQQAAPGSARHQTGVAIFHAEEKRLTGRPLLRHVAGVVTRFEAMWGKRVRGVLCDVTQGGDLWGEAAEHLSLPFRAFTLSEGKEFRFTRTLDYYQALRVFHVAELPALERQQLAYPKIAHDDVLDSAAAAVLAFLEPKPTRNSETIFPT
jgi:hypothetical protein